MIGVVVWADTAKSKAVIWCEDQGDLAYYVQQDVVSKPTLLKKGDLVEFKIHYESGLRMAAGVRVVDMDARPGLADVLKAGVPTAGSEAVSGDIAQRETVVDSEALAGHDVEDRRDTVHHGAQVTTLSIPARGGEPAQRAAANTEHAGATILPLFPELMRA